MITFNIPYLTGNELKYIKNAVLTGKISGDGLYTKKSHVFFQNKYNFKKCLLTNSCTSALEMAAILLNIKEGDEIFDEVFWDFNTLKNSIQKLNKLFIVFADVKVIDNIHHYHYKQGEVYLGLDFNKFLNQLNLGNIQFDIRIGVYKSGPNYGKPHDHGSGFRIKKGNLGDIYTNKLTL